MKNFWRPLVYHDSDSKNSRTGKDKEGNKVFRLLKCSNCVSCENKKIVFRTRDANSSINIMKLTSCWIEKQERPLCFQISSFTSSSKNNKEDEKVRPS